MSQAIELSASTYARGAIAFSTDERMLLLRRRSGSTSSVRAETEAIIGRVRVDGDRALREMAVEYDGVSLDALEIPRSARRRALEAIPSELRSALERAASNIAQVHAASPPRNFEVETEPGVTVGRWSNPLARVGIYAPGGRAAYASSVLMAAIPARVAGVREIILCSPPQRDGCPAEIVLAACEIGDVDRVFALGGAGAIAAMAYGTESVPGVDRIVGPGNAYVAEAKLQVSRDVGIDSPAGPSELLVICDATCDADTIAREVLAQAEHDVNASVVVVCLDDATASSVATAIESLLTSAPRAEIIRSALEERGAVITKPSLRDAIKFANEFAPEHLLLAIDDPERVVPDIRNVGSVFVGQSSSVVFGDYITGGNHVLPTGGLAHSYSGLGPLDFVRWTWYQKVTPEAAQRLANDTAILATAEGLPAHATAALRWSRQ
jgi:histidinol dehydrogenase